MNLQKPLAGFVVFLSAVVLTLASGCAKKSFAVEVAHGFVGNVYIFCGATVGFPSKPVRVNSLGGGNAESCPGDDAAISVLRDGRTVTATAEKAQRCVITCRNALGGSRITAPFISPLLTSYLGEMSRQELIYERDLFVTPQLSLTRFKPRLKGFGEPASQIPLSQVRALAKWRLAKFAPSQQFDVNRRYLGQRRLDLLSPA